MSEIRLKYEIDMLQGNINRMMVTDDLKEIANMYYYANSRLSTIYRENLDRVCKLIEEKKQQFIPPECNAEDLPFG